MVDAETFCGGHPFPSMLVTESNGPGAARPSSSPTPPGGVTALPLASSVAGRKQCRLHRGTPGTLRAASRRGEALAKLRDYSHFAGVQTGLHSKRTTWGPRGDSSLPSSGPRLLARATKPSLHPALPSFRDTLPAAAIWSSRALAFRGEHCLTPPLPTLARPVALLHSLPPLPPCLHPSTPPHTFIPKLPREGQEEIRKGAWGTNSAPWPHAMELLPCRGPFPPESRSPSPPWPGQSWQLPTPLPSLWPPAQLPVSPKAEAQTVSVQDEPWPKWQLPG